MAQPPLLAENLLVKGENSNRYRLGSLVYELGLTSKHQFNAIDVCTSVLKILAHKTANTAFLCINSNDDAVCIIKEEDTNSIPTPALFVGCRQPLGACAGGMALLSALPIAKVEKMMLKSQARLKAHGNLGIQEVKKIIKSHKKLAIPSWLTTWFLAPHA